LLRTGSATARRNSRASGVAALVGSVGFITGWKLCTARASEPPI
jgi:hypothetical protein